MFYAGFFYLIKLKYSLMGNDLVMKIKGRGENK